jgi:ribosomal-protein-alanine N-acetyltransferase
MTTLHTSRLALRPLAVRDAPTMFAIMRDAETMRFWDWPAFVDPETVEEIVAAQIADMDAGNALYWTVCRDGSAIGCCDLSEIDRHHARAEVGFLFDRASWGQGFAVEAMTAIVGYAFGELGLARLWARFHAGNEKSRALLERLGFTYEGTLRGHVLREGERRDCILYGRLRK